MGRKTFESIGRSLPNRKNIVISSTLNALEGIEVVPTLDQGIQTASKWNKDNTGSDEIVLIGGGFAGLTTALSLSRSKVKTSIILIEPRQRFVFLPLLFELLSD